MNKELWKLTVKDQTRRLHKGSLIKDVFSGRSNPELERLYRYLDSHEEVQFLIKGGNTWANNLTRGWKNS